MSTQRLLGFVSSIQVIPLTEARKLLTRFAKIMQPREIIQITVLNTPTFALIPWSMFQDMFEIVQTVEDPLVMQEFAAFMRDKSKPHPFSDVMRPYYTKTSIFDKYDEDCDQKKEDSNV